MNFELISHDVLETAENFITTSFSDIGQYLLNNVAIAIFLCLGLGYVLGKLKIKSFSIGPTVGTLVVGLLISLILASVGQFKIDGLVKTVFFSLFIFTIGYEVGPAFFSSLRSSGIKIVVLSVFFAATAFGVSLLLFKIFSISPGEAGGIIAGALTQSAVLGTADATVKSILSGAPLAAAEAQMPIAYALTYVFGTAGLLVFMKSIAPRMLGVNLREATKNKIAQTHFKEGSADENVISTLKARAFTVTSSSTFAGKSIGDIERQFDDKLTFEKSFSRGEIYNLRFNNDIGRRRCHYLGWLIGCNGSSRKFRTYGNRGKPVFGIGADEGRHCIDKRF